MYAIVDIETTGGHASANGITEIAIVLHDGNKVTRKYETLINPQKHIPIYISALTGISNEMVANAPLFSEVATEVFSLLHDKIFIAHNVNFDYSFLKYHLSACGYELQTKKLCTVRLSRKVFPGLLSYSLGKLCKQLQVELTNHHRAGGDAEATAILFSMILQNDKDGHIKQSLNRNSKEQLLPPNLSRAEFDKIPNTPGVYYFYNQKGKVVYVGKAKNLKKRVSSHFTGNSANKQRQDFMREIHSINFQECGTELMAFILEATEIKRLWPENNRALKRFEQAYGLFMYEDQRGYHRLLIDKKRKGSTPIYSFNQLFEGHSLLRQLMDEFELCPKLCFIQRNQDDCIGIDNKPCKGACKGTESRVLYNIRVQQAIAKLRSDLPSFALLDEGRTEEEHSVILMEQGHLQGMGYILKNTPVDDITELKNVIQPYPSNDYIRNLVHNYAIRYPERLLSF
ncbi:exonuclease domain-containing protein [Pedobacter sp. P351]|uniref:exonuclease domain-containing protein n=1 Tax=Pedobacter superstes TaxID=3133441 RepID=UPI0030B54F94